MVEVAILPTYEHPAPAIDAEQLTFNNDKAMVMSSAPTPVCAGCGHAGDTNHILDEHCSVYIQDDQKERVHCGVCDCYYLTRSAFRKHLRTDLHRVMTVAAAQLWPDREVAQDIHGVPGPQDLGDNDGELQAQGEPGEEEMHTPAGTPKSTPSTSAEKRKAGLERQEALKAMREAASSSGVNT